jgi:hypothetical protein
MPGLKPDEGEVSYSRDAEASLPPAEAGGFHDPEISVNTWREKRTSGPSEGQ